MAAYQYRALDTSGREQKGVIEAESARSARASLRASTTGRSSARLAAGAGTAAGCGRWSVERGFACEGEGPAIHVVDRSFRGPVRHKGIKCVQRKL